MNILTLGLVLISSPVKYSAQAIEARLWGLTTVKGAKAEDGKDVREKMWELFNDCPPGTVLAEVKSGATQFEFVAVKGWNKEAFPDVSSKRGLALELFDALKGPEGMNIGMELVHLGLAAEEVREEKFVQGEVPYYVVRKETASCEPSAKPKFLRQHETYLITRLDQFRMTALSEENPEDSARFGKIRQRIKDFQSKLEAIQERRVRAEKADMT